MTLDEAVDKALTAQYKDQPPTPQHTVLIKAHKKSERQRWVEHYLLQLKSAGFAIVNQPTYSEMLKTGPLVNFRKTIVQEFRFHPFRLWRFDFAIPAYRLAIEIDGGIWRRGGGGHSHPVGIMKDIEKSNAAALGQWHLLRFTDKEIRSGDSIRMTDEFIQIASLRR